jgi:hypothetical protein
MVVKMDKMTDVPAGSNPDTYQPPGWSTSINDRFSAITFDHASNVVVIVDRLSGNRRKLTFPTENRVVRKAKNQSFRSGRGIDIKV